MTKDSTLSQSSADAPGGGADRREEILGVACDLFFSKGFGAASMRDVASQIGFTQAAIYYHFPSKDAILFALIDEFTTKLFSLLKRAIRATGDPAEDLRQTVRAHILLSRTHYREIKLVIEDRKLLARPFSDRVRVSQLDIYGLYKSRFEDLANTLRAVPVAPSVATFTTLAAINFVYQWYRPGGPMDLETIAAQTVEMLMQGFVAPARVQSADGRKPMTKRRPESRAAKKSAR